MTNTNKGHNFPRLGKTRNKTNEPMEEGIPASSLSEHNKNICKEIFLLQQSKHARRHKLVNLGTKKFGHNPREPLK
jgi:hypothetical protein